MRRPAVIGVLLAALVGTAVPGRSATRDLGQIAFNANDASSYVATLDGRSPHELPRPRGVSAATTWPSWSPDGTRVAYGVRGCGSDQQSAVQQSVLGDCVPGDALVVIAGAHRGGYRIVWSLPGGYVRTVDWARKGDRLAVEVAADVEYTRPLVYVMQADGSGARLLTPGERPVWAPDGKRLAYVSSLDQAVYVRDVDTDTDPVRVSPAGVSVAGAGAVDGVPTIAPAWSPDGRRLVVLGNSAEGRGAWVVASSGAGGWVLPGADDGLHTPSWAPDSRHLAFEGRGGLWVSRYDGAGRRRLTAGAEPTSGGPSWYVSGPSWSPDGRWVAFLREDRDVSHERASLQLIRPDGTRLRTAVDLGDDTTSDFLFTADPPLVWAPSRG